MFNKTIMMEYSLLKIIEKEIELIEIEYMKITERKRKVEVHILWKDLELKKREIQNNKILERERCLCLK